MAQDTPTAFGRMSAAPAPTFFSSDLQTAAEAARMAQGTVMGSVLPPGADPRGVPPVGAIDEQQVSALKAMLPGAMLHVAGSGA